MSEKIVFEDFKSSFEKQNKILKISLLVSTGLLLVILFFTLMNRVYFLKSNAGMLSKTMPTEEVCFNGATSISKTGDLNSSFLNKNIIDYFKANPKDRFTIEKAFTPILLSENKCKVVVVDNGKLRAFVLTLDLNKSYPFGSKIADLNEVTVEESEVK